MVARIIGGSVGTVLVGLLVGFVIAAFGGIVAQDSGAFGNNGESPVARAYMLGLLQQDPGSLTGIRPTRDIAQRALELQGAAQSRTTKVTPLSLTYLGGGNMGQLSVYIYAVGLRTAAGVDQFFPLALTLRGGKVVRSE